MLGGVFAAGVVGSSIIGTAIEFSARNVQKKPTFSRPNTQNIAIGKTLQIASMGLWFSPASRVLAFAPTIVPLVNRTLQQMAPSSCPAECMQNMEKGIDGLAKGANVAALVYFAFLYGSSCLTGGLVALAFGTPLAIANYMLWSGNKS